MPASAPVRTRQQHDQSAVGGGAEPFVAEDAPLAVLEPGLDLDVADVGAARLFGHELGAGDHVLVLVGGHAREIARAGFRIGVLADQVGRGVGGADRAHQPELGLHEQVLDGVFDQRPHRLRPAEGAGLVGHAVEREVLVGHALHFLVGGMVLDPVLVAAEAVAVVQHRRVAVGDAR